MIQHNMQTLKVRKTSFVILSFRHFSCCVGGGIYRGVGVSFIYLYIILLYILFLSGFILFLSGFIGTVRVTFHAVSAKYFVLPARNISCWKAVIGVQRVMGKCFAKREMTNEGYFVNWWKMKSGKTTNVLYRCFC